MPSFDHGSAHKPLVMIPSYNTGQILIQTVKSAREFWQPVWVIIDGSDDGSDLALADTLGSDPGVRIIVSDDNHGKGAALLLGMDEASAAGFTHVLAMDADGQHPASLIPAFIERSAEQPSKMILGRPVFGPEAPALRTNGRKVSNFWANLETLWVGVDDSLFGFRVYPLGPLRMIMRRQRWMRRFDFDVEAVVRLYWDGVLPENIDAPVRYLSKEEGGVSHFQYGRDNVLLTWMHLRLFAEFIVRFPWILWNRLRGR